MGAGLTITGAGDSRRLELADEAATARLAATLAGAARGGDVIALVGELGAGKTALARAFIRARAGDSALEVPSPTFTLVQVYATPAGEVWHVDAYRLADAAEAEELGLDDRPADAVMLVEWPLVLARRLPSTRLEITLLESDAGETARVAALSGGGDWPARLDLALAAS